MTSLLIRSLSSSAVRCAARGNVGHFALSNARTANNTCRINHRQLFTGAFSSEPVSTKKRYWAYIGASAAAVCLQTYAYNKKKKDRKEDANPEKLPKPVFSLSSGTYKAAYYNPIPPSIVQKMKGRSYKEDCPIPISDLAYVKVSHFNMQGQICSGELVVHKKIAPKVIEIFKDIHEARFPIEKMCLIDDYEADDDKSMEDNNSSAFCFRSMTNRPGVVSKHGLGCAVDVNTLLNPWVKGDKVAPSKARKYVDRSLNEPGMLRPDDAVVVAFKKHGFEWGGDWQSLKDYQHFEIDPKKLGIKV